APTPSRKSRAGAATRSASGCQPSPEPSSRSLRAGALDIKQPPSFERAAESHLIRVLQVPPDREPAGGPRHPQPQRLHQTGQIGSGRVALKVRTGGQNYVGHTALLAPRHELPRPHVLRAVPLDRPTRT